MKIGVLSLWLCAVNIAAAMTSSLNPMFSSQMVLQRGKPVPIYGTAGMGEAVRITFADQVKEGVAGSDGTWRIDLDPMDANTTPQSMTVDFLATGEAIVLHDVLVGDVWLCGGQSNMQTVLGFYPTLQSLIQQMTNEQVRLFSFKRQGVGAAEPSKEVVVDPAFLPGWQVSAPNYAEIFSAAAMLFAHEVQPALGVPIGVISANRGGTRISSWLPRPVLESRPEYARYLSPANPDWNPSSANPDAIRSPSFLFNGTIHPLAPYALKGVLWYQGEGNARDPELYHMAMTDLAGSWRTLWDDDFHFLYMQLPPYGDVPWDITGEAWAWLRQAQAEALSIPKSGMGVLMDAGEYLDIHPQDKVAVGQRYALLARQIEDSAVVAQGPRFASVSISGGVARISYDTGTANGLHVREVRLNHNRNLPPGADPEAHVAPADAVRGFMIAGADGPFVEAQAYIDGDEVVVHHPDVPEPVAVRYGWVNFPLANLYNSAGLPAEPFRTDSREQPVFELSLATRPLGEAETLPGVPMDILWAAGGSVIVSNVVEDRLCWTSIPTGSDIRYMYFKASDSSLSQGISPRMVIRIAYFDEDYYDIYLRYDSSDESVNAESAPGAWKDAGIIRMNNTLTWRVAEVEVDDALFAHRLHGGDIRLQVYGQLDFSVHAAYGEPLGEPDPVWPYDTVLTTSGDPRVAGNWSEGLPDTSTTGYIPAGLVASAEESDTLFLTGLLTIDGELSQRGAGQLIFNANSSVTVGPTGLVQTSNSHFRINRGPLTVRGGTVNSAGNIDLYGTGVFDMTLEAGVVSALGNFVLQPNTSTDPHSMRTARIRGGRLNGNQLRLLNQASLQFDGAAGRVSVNTLHLEGSACINFVSNTWAQLTIAGYTVADYEQIYQTGALRYNDFNAEPFAEVFTVQGNRLARKGFPDENTMLFSGDPLDLNNWSERVPDTAHYGIIPEAITATVQGVANVTIAADYRVVGTLEMQGAGALILGPNAALIVEEGGWVKTHESHLRFNRSPLIVQGGLIETAGNLDLFGTGSFGLTLNGGMVNAGAHIVMNPNLGANPESTRHIRVRGGTLSGNGLYLFDQSFLHFDGDGGVVSVQSFHPDGRAYINFEPSTQGMLTISGFDAEGFENLYASGQLRYDGGRDGAFTDYFQVADSTVRLKVIDGQTFEDWTNEQEIPEGFRGWNDDPFGYGVKNLEAYATGMSQVPPIRSTLSIRIEDGVPLVALPWRTNIAPDIAFFIGTSSNLETWDSEVDLIWHSVPLPDGRVEMQGRHPEIDTPLKQFYSVQFGVSGHEN